MDQSTGQSQTPPPPQNAGQRDMMFCHECHDEWYRDEHGLTCPECGSDFTEIIEQENDPRGDHMPGHDDDDDEDNDSLPSLEEVPPHLHPHHDHNPWRDNDDPTEEDISGLQWRQLGPNRFAVTGTIHRTVSPADMGRGGGNNGLGPIGGFAGLLNNIIGGTRPPPSQNSGNEDTGGSGMPGSGSGTLPGGGRFQYTSTARLFPGRNDHFPGPHMQPEDELNNVLVGLFAAFGQQPGPHDPRHFHGPGGARGPPMNPFLHLFSQMLPGNGQLGDAVYSQEALDRIISQLMEQNATSNAPGPASQNDIDTLPRKQVGVDMLGSEGRAECSICMEEVNIGEEVTELPCHHWFHHACIAAWLGEHDTCPHCRKGITKQSENPGNQNQSSNTGGPSDSSPNRSMPGSFGAFGEGAAENPFVVPGDRGQDTQTTSQSPARPASAGDAGSGGGLGERLRRGLFGPPSR